MARVVRADSATKDQARHYKSELLASMFGVLAFSASGSGGSGQTQTLQDAIPAGSNVVGIGFGAKEVAGSGVDDLAVRVYVRAKQPPSALTLSEKVPGDVNGMPTDVVPVGDLSALVRPTPCGVSVGHFRITAGTLGCLVEFAGGSLPMILSNNHVLADTNTASLGDDIYEPGPIDGGTPPAIAQLTDFKRIDFAAPNDIDAAIAQLVDPTDVTPDLKVIGPIVQPPVPASLYQSVRKHGRTTLHTVGVIMDLSADIKVRYGNLVAQFDDQLGIVGVNGPFSQGGDSGSLIVDAVERNPVALLFAGGGSMTFANPIDSVLGHFGITIL